MNVIDLIKSFKTFEIGDFVVCNDKLFQIKHQPCFKYTVHYTDGDFDNHYVNDVSEIRTDDFTILGYGVKYINRFSKFTTDFRHFLIVNYEKYDPNVHTHLNQEYQKFQLMLQLQQLNK